MNRGAKKSGGNSAAGKNNGKVQTKAEKNNKKEVYSEDKGINEIALYFHIPFCVSKCAYCAFFSKAGEPEELKKAYAEALCSHIKLFPDKGRFAASSVYFGGGTPPLLGADALLRVLDVARSVFGFVAEAEVTLEVNPLTVGFAELKALRAGGFNRLSIGLQSANAASLRRLSRAHSPDDFLRCFYEARNAGFDNISADIIFALPDEGEAELEATLRTLAALRPEHISAYGLSLEEGTPLFRDRAKYRFPDEEGEERQYYIICEELRALGYRHYEISNFALEGFESRHNRAYWTRSEYMGFGAAAHSYLYGRRFSSPPDIERYISAVGEGFFAPTDFERARILTEAEREEERVMLGLRLAEGVRIDKKIPSVIIDGGYGVFENGVLKLTDKGFRVSNTIISMLLG